jgi:hypothetical protein
MTREGDLVLVYMDGKAAFFARIEAIESDPKPEWFQVKMLVLQVPLAPVTWILREAYINGVEFTMGGHPMRLEKVVYPLEEEQLADEGDEEQNPAHGDDSDALKPVSRKGNVVSLFDRPKKHHPS